ncbi:hypothetical protein T11_14699 [Trichinella zimbabwensis]|uniref:Uncharacterized protein n=1 Tax=Trichinella zimbabwensis TaxID=268475 RepID=A0A0V1HC17_9BILA|nr:hypothetical protein T11_14699 [Trichinella zimbabwensis]
MQNVLPFPLYFQSLATLDLHIFHLSHAQSGHTHYYKIHELSEIRLPEKNSFHMRKLLHLLPKAVYVDIFDIIQETAFGDFFWLLSSFSASDSLATCVGTTKSSFEISIVSALPSGDPGVEPLMRNEFDDDPFPSIILKSLSYPYTAFTKEELNYIDRSKTDLEVS